MHEFIALARLSLVQFRWVYLTFILATALSPVLALLYLVTGGSSYVHSLVGIWLSLSIAAGFAGVTLFDFTQRGDLISPQSGCNHWLLRMPVASWKIALTPVVLKTAWFALIWAVIAAIITASGEPVPILGPMFCFSGAAIGLMAISWMPFRAGWHRLVLVPVILIAAYLLFLLLVLMPHTNPKWHTVVYFGGSVLPIAFYVGCVSAAFWVVNVARTATLGLTSERIRSTWWPQSGIENVAANVEPVRTFRDPGRALVWHEFHKTRKWAVRALLIGAVPAIFFFGLIFPLDAATIVGAVIVFTYIAAFAVGGAGDVPVSTSDTGFPSYLLTSPISTARLAWTRFVVRIGIAAAVFSTIFIAFSCAALWSTNRHAWSMWAKDISSRIQMDAAPMEVGLRVSAAIALVAFVFFLGQLASHWWFGLSGSSWLFLTVAFIELAFVFVSVSIFLYWFIRQSDWQQVQNSFSVGLTWLPMIAARLLTIKFVAVIVISILLIRNRLCDFSTLMKLVIAWTAFVMLLASGLSALLPLPQATFLACAAAIAILTPLARILVMPVMLAYGRHR